MDEQVGLAEFEVGGTSRVKAQFNPATLKVTASNQIADGQGTAFQASAKTALKFDFELIFDTTETGADVQADVHKVQALAIVAKPSQPLEPVTFRWGSFAFTGAIESVNTTFDFFSAKGTPLRATLAVSMKGLRLEEPPASAASAQGPAAAPALAGPAGVTSVAQAAGDPRAGRAIAAASGLESMRMPPPGRLSMPLNAVLRGPSGAASAGRSGGTALAALVPGSGAASSADFATPGSNARFDLSGRLVSASGAMTGGM